MVLTSGRRVGWRLLRLAMIGWGWWLRRLSRIADRAAVFVVMPMTLAAIPVACQWNCGRVVKIFYFAFPEQWASSVILSKFVSTQISFPSEPVILTAIRPFDPRTAGYARMETVAPALAPACQLSL